MSVEVAFLYVSSITSKMKRVGEGKLPLHHLFGLAEIAKFGVKPCWLDPEMNGGILASRKRIINNARSYNLVQALWAVTRPSRARGPCFVLFAVQEGSAYWPLLLKTVGIIKMPVVVVNIGLLRESHCRGWRRTAWRILLKRARFIVSYASVQSSHVAQIFGVPREYCRSVSFGVDVEFFAEPAPAQPPNELPNVPYILSAGTNEGKDYPTLLDAVDGLPLHVLIATDRLNLRHIERHGIPANVTAREANMQMPVVRELYRHSIFGIIPMGVHLFSSGQTILLENMAMGKAMIVADVPCIRDYVSDNVTALLYPPGDSAALRCQIERLIMDVHLRNRLGEAARQAVVARFSSSEYARSVAAILRQAANPHQIKL